MTTCKHCGGQFPPGGSPHGGRQKQYCDDVCKLKATYARRKAAGKVPKSRMLGLRLPEIDLTCRCGEPLTGFAFDRLGRTLEICTHGHETSCIERRRIA